MDWNKIPIFVLEDLSEYCGMEFFVNDGEVRFTSDGD